jgi:hypothetical protein
MGEIDFIKGYECPDDLGPDEPCSLGVFIDEKEKGIDKMDFKDFWNKKANAETKTHSYEDLPEGNYITEVISCKMGKTKSGTKSMVSWDLKVIEGEQKNNHIFVNRPFYWIGASESDITSEQNDKAIDRMMDDFKLLGLKITADVLNETMLKMVGKTIEISLKNGTNGQFQNFRRIVEPKPTSSEQEPISAVPVFPVDEESPF